MTPLGLSLLFLAGAAPLLAWRKTTRERLWNQFAFPLGLAAVTVVTLLIFFPQTNHLSPIFADNVRLPISLINFGLVAFTVGSIGQEFWRGAAVRRRQSGSDPITSLLGLVLAKNRKYGGYIVHLGIAVMFVGFAGKAYERMADRTVEVPAFRSNPTKASFTFDDYTFTYYQLIHTSDDHKDAITAQVGVSKDGKEFTTRYPSKWDYHKQDGNLISQVAIVVRPPPELGGGDVYIVLTGYDTDSGLANFRVYINPLILWVWVGFLILACGTLVCLVPKSLIERLQWKPRSPLGRAADVGIVLAIMSAVVVGLAGQAHAAPPPAAEHVPAGMGMGQAGAGYAAMARPTNDTEQHAMKELLCPCGCARQSIFECECPTAARLRQHVMDLMATADLKSEDGRKQAYDAVLAAFVQEYGGEQVLATPRSSFTWLLPLLAALGGLGALFVVGRRWVARSADATPVGRSAAGAATPSASDDAYDDKLDDELARTED
jgi:cytochrome c-type biogenesis protein CcmF